MATRSTSPSHSPSDICQPAVLSTDTTTEQTPLPVSSGTDAPASTKSKSNLSGRRVWDYRELAFMREEIAKDEEIQKLLELHQWRPASEILSPRLLDAFYAYPAPAETGEEFATRKAGQYRSHAAKKLKRRVVPETLAELAERKRGVSKAVHLWIKNHYSNNEARAKRINFDTLFECAVLATGPHRARSAWDVMRSDPTLHPPMAFSETVGADGPEKTPDWGTYNPELSKAYHGLSPEQRADVEQRVAEENDAAKGNASKESVKPEVTRAELARYGVDIVRGFMDMLQEKLGWTGHVMFGGVDHRGNLVAHDYTTAYTQRDRKDFGTTLSELSQRRYYTIQQGFVMHLCDVYDVPGSNVDHKSSFGDAYRQSTTNHPALRDDNQALPPLGNPLVSTEPNSAEALVSPPARCSREPVAAATPSPADAGDSGAPSDDGHMSMQQLMADLPSEGSVYEPSADLSATIYSSDDNSPPPSQSASPTSLYSSLPTPFPVAGHDAVSNADDPLSAASFQQIRCPVDAPSHAHDEETTATGLISAYREEPTAAGHSGQLSGNNHSEALGQSAAATPASKVANSQGPASPAADQGRGPVVDTGATIAGREESTPANGDERTVVKGNTCNAARKRRERDMPDLSNIIVEKRKRNKSEKILEASARNTSAQAGKRQEAASTAKAAKAKGGAKANGRPSGTATNKRAKK